MPQRPADEHDARLVADHFGVPASGSISRRRSSGSPSGLQAAAADCPPRCVRRSLPEGADRRDRGSAAERQRAAAHDDAVCVANALDYLVAGPASRTTLTVGTIVKHGDGGVDLLPLGGLLNSDVRTLATALDVPDAISNKPAGPQAGSPTTMRSRSRPISSGI